MAERVLPDSSGVDCPHRLLLDQISDKWSILIIAALSREPLRFNQMKKRFLGITQRVLTHTLRKLERNGIIERHVLTTSPVGVQYNITSLGRTLEEPFQALARWTHAYLPDVETARQRFDGRG